MLLKYRAISVVAMAKVEIKCTENGPNLIVVDGNVFAACADAEHQAASLIVTEPMRRLNSRQRQKS